MQKSLMTIIFLSLISCYSHGIVSNGDAMETKNSTQETLSKKIAKKDLKEQLEQRMQKASNFQTEDTEKSIEVYKEAIAFMDKNPEIKDDYYYVYAHYIMSFLYPQLDGNHDKEIVEYSKKGLAFVEPIYVHAPFIAESKFQADAIAAFCNAIVWHSLETTHTTEDLEKLLTYIDKGFQYAELKDFPNIYSTKVDLLLKLKRNDEAYKQALDLKKAKVDSDFYKVFTKTAEYKEWYKDFKGDETEEKEAYVQSLKNADGTTDGEYSFARLKTAMYAYSKAVSEVESEGFKNEFKDFVSASDEYIHTLEEKMGIPLPEELKAFYKKMGRLNSDWDESHAFRFVQPERLLKTWRGKEVTHSFGIVDGIIDHWGGDRPEFQHPERYESGLTKKETAYLNENFKCIGTWSHNWGYEASYYLIFDKNGNVGYIYFHQDEFDNTATRLRELMKNGIKPQSLEDVLSKALNEQAKEMLNDE